MRIAAFDVGATSIKSQVFDGDGTALQGRSRRPTPRPCGPEDLLRLLVARAAVVRATWVGVAFPGDLTDGVVTDCGNLARVGGAGTAEVLAVRDRWTAAPLERDLAVATGVPVLVVNDATAAATGCLEGRGRELVVTLGTGVGVALVVDGAHQAIGDTGGSPWGNGTVDEAAGESARARDEWDWTVTVGRVLEALVAQWEPDVVHLAGGNARRLRPDVVRGPRVVIARGDPALRGLVTLVRASAGA